MAVTEYKNKAKGKGHYSGKNKKKGKPAKVKVEDEPVVESTSEPPVEEQPMDTIEDEQPVLIQATTPDTLSPAEEDKIVDCYACHRDVPESDVVSCDTCNIVICRACLIPKTCVKCGKVLIKDD